MRNTYKTYEKFQIVDCSKINSCKGCSNAFGCVWCVGSKKCMPDLSGCHQEKSVVDPMGCDIIEDVVDNSGSTLTGGNCSVNNNCNSCLTSPGCFWCANKNICSSNEKVYSECFDEKSIYNSIEQCNLKKSIDMNYPQTESVMPISGLSRNIDGSLTNSSLKIIFDSFASKGNRITDSQSKQNALQMVNNEIAFYSNMYKSYINTYVDKAIDYTSDPKSLSKAENVKQHIEDLNDVSRFINNYDTSKYVEGFQNEDKFQYTLQENKNVNNNIQLLWLGNLIAIGTLFYLMR